MGAVIRVHTRDSGWETLGVDRYRGITAENIEATANPWGPDQLSFNIKAGPRAQRPDLLPFRAVELEIDGLLCWAGRVRARPSVEAEHAVQCQGWQYHLDDDAFSRVYVHTRLGDYRDSRTFLGTNLANFHVGGSVSNDDGSILIGWPNGAILPNGACVGVTLDLGPDSGAKRIVIDWESTNNAPGTSFIARCIANEDPGATADDAITFAMNSGASGTSAGTFATADRYVHLFLYQATGATTTADLHLRIKAVKVFRATAYESGNASVLNASLVIKDALTFAPMINPTQLRVVDVTDPSVGGIAIPEYVTQGYQSPREVIEAINAYENLRHKIGGSDLQTLIYDLRPADPLYEVGEWSGSQFADDSVSGDDIYDKVIVTGTGPDGAPLVRTRTQPGTLIDKADPTVQGGALGPRTKVLPISSALTDAVGDRFGDLWLAEHKLAPFSGKLQASSGIRRVLGGASVPPHEMLLAAGEKIRLSHRVDPDTGSWGRDGKIAGVTYRHNTRSVDIAIDDRRDHFESILQRYGVLVDQLS